MSKFTRTVPIPSVKGIRYGRFRPFVRRDFEQRCAYCLIPELWAQGESGFHLDHFLPQVDFTAFVNDFYNLYWACYACNHRKHDKFPSLTAIANGASFIDYCSSNFDEHFSETQDGEWIPKTTAAAYTVEMLLLNSKHFKTLRQELRSKHGVKFSEASEV